MAIEISKEAHKTALASIQRYFAENMDDEIGNLEAGALLGFFLKEIGPAIYNQAVADAQTRMQARVMEQTSRSTKKSSNTGRNANASERWF